MIKKWLIRVYGQQGILQVGIFMMLESIKDQMVNMKCYLQVQENPISPGNLLKEGVKHCSWWLKYEIWSEKMISKKDKKEILHRLKPSMMHCLTNNHSDDFIEGYNCMLERANKIIEEY